MTTTGDLSSHSLFGVTGSVALVTGKLETRLLIRSLTLLCLCAGGGTGIGLMMAQAFASNGATVRDASPL